MRSCQPTSISGKPCAKRRPTTSKGSEERTPDDRIGSEAPLPSYAANESLTSPSEPTVDSVRVGLHSGRYDTHGYELSIAESVGIVDGRDAGASKPTTSVHNDRHLEFQSRSIARVREH